MSHQVKIATQFKVENFDSLKTAFNRLGWQVVESAESRTYGSGKQSYPFVAVNPDTCGYNVHDIGMSLGPELVELTSDMYGGSIEKSLGNDLGKLKQEFAATVIENHFYGAVVSREVLENQDMYVTVNL
jgi:hypothetical protein